MNLLRRIAALFRRSSLDREIEDELQAHIAMRTEDNIADGMSPDAAARDARLRFETRPSSASVRNTSTSPSASTPSGATSATRFAAIATRLSSPLLPSPRSRSVSEPTPPSSSSSTRFVCAVFPSQTLRSLSTFASSAATTAWVSPTPATPRSPGYSGRRLNAATSRSPVSSPGPPISRTCRPGSLPTTSGLSEPSTSPATSSTSSASLPLPDGSSVPKTQRRRAPPPTPSSVTPGGSRRWVDGPSQPPSRSFSTEPCTASSV